MHLIVCLDPRDGMLFNRRRQSSDRLLRERLLQRVGEVPLWMNGYSAKQFVEPASFRVDEAFLEKAGAGEYVFVENVDVAPYANKVESITVYRWDKVYPGDAYFPWAAFAASDPAERTEFAGYSHEVLTEEVYPL